MYSNIKKIYQDKINDILPPTASAIASLIDCSINNIFGYSHDGNLTPGANSSNNIGAGQLGKKYLITVTKNGYVKKTVMDDVWKGKATKGLKLKDDDELIYANTANDEDFVILLGEDDMMTKLAVSGLTTAGKLTLGSAAAIGNVLQAVVASDEDTLMFVDSENKGKLVMTKELATKSRTAKGQKINEGVKWVLNVQGRDTIYIVSKGKILPIDIAKKMSVKSKTASGAELTSKPIDKIL